MNELMNDRATGTLRRAEKGPVAAPPALDGPLQAVVDAVSAWSGVDTTVHWHLVHRSRPDGVDFYWHEEELGHLHLDGSVHLATSARLGRRLIEERAAEPFRYQRGWVEAHVGHIGPDAAIALFRRNYEDLRRQSDDAGARAA